MDISFLESMLDDVLDKVAGQEKMSRLYLMGHDIKSMEFHIDLRGTEYEELGFYSLEILGEEQVIKFEIDTYALKKCKTPPGYVKPVCNLYYKLSSFSDYSDFLLEYHVISQELANKKGITEFDITYEWMHNNDYEYLFFDIEVLGGTYYTGSHRSLYYDYLLHFRNAKIVCHTIYIGIWDIKDYKTRNLEIEASQYKFDMHVSKSAHRFIKRVFQFLQKQSQVFDNKDVIFDEDGDAFCINTCQDIEVTSLAQQITFRFLVTEEQSDRYVRAWMKSHLEALKKYIIIPLAHGYDVEVAFYKESDERVTLCNVTNYDTVYHTFRLKDGSLDEYEPIYMGLNFEGLELFDSFYCMD